MKRLTLSLVIILGTYGIGVASVNSIMARGWDCGDANCQPAASNARCYGCCDQQCTGGHYQQGCLDFCDGRPRPRGNGHERTNGGGGNSTGGV